MFYLRVHDNIIWNNIQTKRRAKNEKEIEDYFSYEFLIIFLCYEYHYG